MSIVKFNKLSPRGVNTRNRARGTVADTQAATELEMHIDNTRALYDIWTSIARNLLRKVRAKKFDRKKSPKAFEHLAEAGARSYAKEYGDAKTWSTQFNAATRRHVAESYAKDFDAKLKGGELDWLLPRNLHKLAGTGLASPRVRAARKAKAANKAGSSTRAFAVRLHGKKIDTVFYNASGTIKDQVEDVRRGLVNHDGYDPAITVSIERKARSGGKRKSNKARAKKPSRMSELKASLPKGWTVETWSPGDGITRYRFFHNAPAKQTYFGPDNGRFTALGLKEANAYARGIGSDGAKKKRPARMSKAKRAMQKRKSNKAG